ncbi:hypothetical protein SODALDRAFT_376215 [Sodiomyces alkalinus F11]|uniref:Uncharacterized protein n=1 Tax=Sodiomyces alkalinus (strain CBS 110278 / VKM F-3762 / F11) TaxID=1314773 RepID=A0A3N2Q162_SODAK|nr:hypothetical protein SODALDRAFT_376215 [Sodiomyces alkalinus F11]ROT40428.1 hypothetical protein SODALDRAFT_376215 [Sodiomyces alkalinus F11]
MSADCAEATIAIGVRGPGEMTHGRHVTVQSATDSIRTRQAAHLHIVLPARLEHMAHARRGQREGSFDMDKLDSPRRMEHERQRTGDTVVVVTLTICFKRLCSGPGHAVSKTFLQRTVSVYRFIIPLLFQFPISYSRSPPVQKLPTFNEMPSSSPQPREKAGGFVELREQVSRRLQRTLTPT